MIQSFLRRDQKDAPFFHPVLKAEKEEIYTLFNFYFARDGGMFPLCGCNQKSVFLIEVMQYDALYEITIKGYE